VKLLASLPSRNTDGLIGGVVKVLEAKAFTCAIPPGCSSRCWPALAC